MAPLHKRAKGGRHANLLHAPLREDKAGFLSIQPPEFARAALNTVGCGEDTVPPGWQDWVQRAMIGITPASAMRDAMKGLFEKMQKKQKAN